jgi:N-acetylglucosamine-6-phosphate deacetylase
MSNSYTGRTIDGDSVRVSVTAGHIDAVEPVAADPELPYLMPVLVDLQHNGSLGTHYNSVANADQLQPIADHLRRHGVGRCLATLTTYPYDDLIRTAAVFDAVLAADPALARLFCGLFHEGVFISPDDGWRGAHVADWVRPPDYDRFAELDAASGGRVRVVNVAPEQPGGLDFVARAAAAGKLVALGHAGPDAATVRRAADLGATLVTHFGNGAPNEIHRHRNPFWSFLADPRLRLGLICDGFHLPPDLVAAALTGKREGGCFVVSDANGAAGMPPGEYEQYGGSRRIVISEQRKIHLPNSETLSGAWYQLDRCVEFLVCELGFDLREAWHLCSTVPATVAGITLPTLAAGEEASFVVARWQDGLILEQCVHAGRPFLDAPVTPRTPAPAA